jgi:hypothetical protein
MTPTFAAGIYNVASGLLFKTPIPVQPMKVIQQAKRAPNSCKIIFQKVLEKFLVQTNLMKL